jgi:GH43 family beta-xylosidase
MHYYKGKYYLFLTFDSQTQLQEQWHDWRPRVFRGSQILWGESPNGPFQTFTNHSTTPTNMMTLDGTFWVEDGVPYMVFCNEWVQISDGTVEYMPLKDDLSEAAGPPKRMFRASSAKWSELVEAGGHVTDGPYVWKGKTGKLYVIWSSRAHDQRYQCGVAISNSGKLAGPWRQEDTPIFSDYGGHGMLFNTFEGKLMMVLHAPDGGDSGPRRPRIFEIEDTGETLRIVKEFTDE